MKLLPLVCLVGILITSSALASENTPCGEAVCVSQEVCEDTLAKLYNYNPAVLEELCGEQPELSEWRQFRRPAVFTKSLDYTKWFDENGLYHLSALNMLMLSYMIQPVERMDSIMTCTKNYYNQIGVRSVRAYDVCEPIVAYYPEQEQRVLECSLKHLSEGSDPDKSLNACIDEIFYP